MDSTLLPRLIHLWAPGFQGFGGGITAFSRELAAVLDADRNRLELWGKTDRRGVLDKLIVRGAGGVPAGIRTPWFAARIIGSAVVKRPDLIISTHLNFGPAAKIAARFSGSQYVLVAHGIDVHEGLAPKRKQALREAAAVWAVSQWTRDRLLAAGVPANRITVLSNTVDDVRFSPGPQSSALKERYGIDPADKVVLTVGRLDSSEAYKGYDVVLAALPAIRSAAGRVRYLIAGAGDDRPRIERLADQLGIRAHVTFCGFVPDDELPDHYRLADAFAMPSRGEGFGIVFLEAMACGTPVLGGNADGTKDALANGDLGELVDPMNVDAVAAGVTRLLRGEGPRWWFDPFALREHMLALHGRVAFARRVREALSVLPR